ncbi:MAG: ABC transporter ATP-binding protein [Pseudomonadota bacterium]
MSVAEAMPAPTRELVLTAQDLSVTFDTPDGAVHAVKGVSLDVAAGECLGIVGESGSGKSQLFLSIMGLLASNGAAAGKAQFKGADILNLSPQALNAYRGQKMTMIFQDPLTSLTPHMKIGRQLIEVLTIHQELTRGEAERRALEMLEKVRIPLAARRMNQYPHELSGGMRQRVMIAMSLLCDPDLLIADEPTTALDVTVQAQILDLLRELKDDLGTAIVLITHDMGVVAGICDRINVMQHGTFVETGTTDEIFYRPQHDYTKMLLAAMPRIDEPAKAGPDIAPPDTVDTDGPPLLTAQDVKVHFPIRTGGLLFGQYTPLRAVDGVSFSLQRGETLGIVGESGCGKSTLARAVLQLVTLSGGSVVWAGADLAAKSKPQIRDLREEFQIVFQYPLASLDPRMTIGESIAQPLRRFKPELEPEAIKAEVRGMMVKVGLEPRWINRYPHEFSGGQNQRVGIARAMILKPKMIVCDEAVSALDVSIQAQILKLLLDLQKEFGLSMLFISHDLSVVRQISHRVMVLFLGRIVELADRDQIYDDPRHPYTQTLISAVPIPDPVKERAKVRLKLPGELPSPLDPQAGLYFMPSKRVDLPDPPPASFEPYQPRLEEVTPGHFVAEHDPYTPPQT